MNGKKIIALLIALVLVMSMLGGCASKDEAAPAPSEAAVSEAPEDAAPASQPAESADAPEETPAEAPSEEPAPVEEVSGPPALELPLASGESLSLWYSYPPWLTNFIEIDDKPIFVEAEKLLGVDLEITGVSILSSSEQFNLMVASGDMTDVFSDFNYSSGMDAGIADEVIIDLTDLINTCCPSYYALRQDETIRRGTTTLEGNAPVFYAINDDNIFIRGGHWINADMLSEVGMEKPVTYDDWHELLTAFKTELGADSPLWTEASGLNADIMAGFGVTPAMYQVDGTVKFGVVEDGFYDYLEMMSKWYSEGLIYGDFYSQEVGADKPDASLIDSRRSGIWRNSSNAYNNYTVAAEAIMLPVANEGDTLHFSEIDSKVGMSNLAISTCCENPELAAKWCDFWYSEQGSMMCNYGIEGLSYNLDADGKPIFTDLVTNNPEGMTYNNAIAIYCMFNCWGYVVDNTKMDGSYNQYQLESRGVWADHNDNAWKIPSGVTLTQTENEQYTATYADIETYIEENALKFVTGELPLSDYESFKDRIFEMGIEDCMAIYQSAVDRYMAN